MPVTAHQAEQARRQAEEGIRALESFAVSLKQQVKKMGPLIHDIRYLEDEGQDSTEVRIAVSRQIKSIRSNFSNWSVVRQGMNTSAFNAGPIFDTWLQENPIPAKSNEP